MLFHSARLHFDSVLVLCFVQSVGFPNSKQQLQLKCQKFNKQFQWNIFSGSVLLPARVLQPQVLSLAPSQLDLTSIPSTDRLCPAVGLPLLLLLLLLLHCSTVCIKTRRPGYGRGGNGEALRQHQRQQQKQCGFLACQTLARQQQEICFEMKRTKQRTQLFFCWFALNKKYIKYLVSNS